MAKKKHTLQEAQQEYYAWLLKNKYDKETSKELAFRTEQEIKDYEDKVLSLIEKMDGKFPLSAELEKKAFKEMDVIYKIQAMHFHTPESLVDLLFL